MNEVFHFLGRIAKRLGVYRFIRYSPFYDLIQRVRNPDYFRHLDEDEAFYRRVLNGRPASLIFDVGANVGDKAAVFSRIASRVVCFEPDPRLALHLKRRFAQNTGVVIEATGVSESSGILDFHAFDDGSAFNTMSAKQHEQVAPLCANHSVLKVPDITLDEAIKRHGLPDFLKVDVEGHEREVINGLSQIVRMVSIEANLPAFREETCDVAKRLAELSPGTRFAVCGSGLIFDFSFPLTCRKFCNFVRRDDAPAYLEAFAKLLESPEPS